MRSSEYITRRAARCMSMDFFAERVFYCLVAADALLFLFLCAACVVTCRRRANAESAAVETAVIVEGEACPGVS